MLAGWILRRQFHIASGLWSTQPSSVLATLRKKTGYTFANCKKALEVNNNDVVKVKFAQKYNSKKLIDLNSSLLPKILNIILHLENNVNFILQ